VRVFLLKIKLIPGYRTESVVNERRRNYWSDGENHDLQRVLAKNEYTYEMYFWRKKQRMFSVACFFLYADTTTDKRYPLSTASTPALRPTQPKVKRPERQADHPPPPSAEV